MPDQARYRVTTVDFCVQGFERLRSQSEFILLAYPSYHSSVSEVRKELVDDIQSCMREDGFDYEAARAAINAYVQETWSPHALFRAYCDMPPEADEDEDAEEAGEGPQLFVYVEDLEAQ